MNTPLKIFAAAVIAAALVLAVTSFWEDSVIVDEVPHIGAGYSYLKKQDMRMNPEHPPLAKDLAAVPLLFLEVNQEVFNTTPWQGPFSSLHQWEFGRKLLFSTGNDAILMTRLIKLPMLIFFILAALLLLRWSQRLYGPKGAIIALILFCFSPTILAHARFVTTDVPALFAILFATYFFIKYLRLPTQKNFWIAAIMFGVALLTKFSMFLLIPFLGLLAVVWGHVHAPTGKRFASWISWGFRSVAVFAAGFILVVWPVYYFHTYNYPPERQKADTVEILTSFGNRLLAEPVVWLSDKPILRAAGQYGLGFLMVVQRSAGGNTIYFLGEVVTKGGPFYFPIVYFLKEPLAWWGLVIIVLAALAMKVKSFLPGRQAGKLRFSSLEDWVRGHFEEFAMLLWLAVYWATSIQSLLNIGVRHLLPIYPFTIILVSGQLARLIGRQARLTERLRMTSMRQFRVVTVLIAALCGWYVMESVGVHPFYLTYFNQVAGGPSGGYKYVVDSNLDWGQDLKRFSDWVKAENIQRIELDYFGWADPGYYLQERYLWASATKYTDAQDFIARNQSDGWLAVSATFLQGSEGPPDRREPVNYRNWLWAYEPVTVIGNSIFVYRIK